MNEQIDTHAIYPTPRQARQWPGLPWASIGIILAGVGCILFFVFAASLL